jgi:hypothetical protein
MLMMKNPTNCPLTMCTGDIGTLHSILGGSSALFGDQSFHNTSRTSMGVAEMFKGQEIPCIALGLMIKENAIIAYCLPLLDDIKIFGCFCTNLAAVLTLFVKLVQVPITPAVTTTAATSHYFLPDSIDFVSKPVNENIELDD